MRLLFDQNLSRRLVGELADEFPESGHVRSLGLDTATDQEIWDYAGQRGHLIVSKDSDFRQLAFLLGPPPKAIWLRIGNRSTAAIADVLRSAADVMRASRGPRKKPSWCYLTFRSDDSPQARPTRAASASGLTRISCDTARLMPT